MNSLIILTGPTAVGKTKISVDLAKKINAEIISADSVQVYRNMDIGSAKTTPGEMCGIKHHLIDILDPDEEFNVYSFESMAKKCMMDIYKRGKIPMVVGGTGFYIQALLYNVNFSKTGSNLSYRERLENIAKEGGGSHLFEFLRIIDPDSAKIIHPHNEKRVIRAIEYMHDTGEMISNHNKVQKENKSPYNFVYFVLTDERNHLYNKINKRVDEMMNLGLEEEVRKLIDMGYSPKLKSMQSIGYKEMCKYILGECTMEQAVEEIKKNTRHFAKRQMTWFRRERNVELIKKDEFLYDDEKIVDYMLNILRKQEIMNV